METTTRPSEDNCVFLRGRLACEPVIRAMPSGDELCVFRITVDRPPGSRARVDSIDCSTTKSRVRKTLGRMAAGDALEVTGSLRRRFWRGAGGLGSRYEVEVVSVRVNSRRRSAA